MYSYHSATVESDSGKKLSDGVIISFAFDQMSIHLNNTDKIKIIDDNKAGSHNAMFPETKKPPFRGGLTMGSLTQKSFGKSPYGYTK